MALEKDLDLSRHHLMPMMMMDQPDNTELLYRPTRDDLALGPEPTTRGFCLPRQRTLVIQKGTMCRTGTSRRRSKSHERTQMDPERFPLFDAPLSTYHHQKFVIGSEKANDRKINIR
jgi:hypothetical protein